MKHWILAVAGVFLIPAGGSNILRAQQHYHRHFTDGERYNIICYYSETPDKRYLPPPEAYTSRLKSGEEAGAKFTLIIENSPGSQADSALMMAGEIWGSLVYSPVPITVKVNFADLDKGTLASTGVPWPPYVLDNNGNLDKRIYVQTLAEKMLGRNLNGNEPDMTMTFSTRVLWYYGSDGNIPDYKYDLLTTALHEMAHGLGFFGFFGVDANDVGYGFTLPGVMDGFFANGSGDYLSDTLKFPNPSKALGTALVTIPVYFMSPLVSYILPNEAPGPKMYISNPWRSGNSLYHIESRYSLQSVNDGRDALMTYSTSPGEALHDPGLLATNMLYELGWVHTYVLHDTLKDREDISDPFTVSAIIHGDMGVKPNSQKLFYRFDNGGFDSVNMETGAVRNEYTAGIPVVSDDVTVDYYIQTQDSFQRIYSMPPKAPGHVFTFVVGPDDTPPSISHTPIAFILATNDTVEVRADIWDNLGLDTTVVEYMINDVPQTPFALEYDTLSQYKGYFIFGEGGIKAGDVIKYRIKAVDGSVSALTTYLPAEGYHEFNVEDVPPFVDYYENDFEAGIGDFLVDRFYHAKPSGFSSYGLHSGHPYPSPNRDNATDQIYAQLKVPIRLNPGMMQLKFDEIAYIENGDVGSEFGDDNFWDYAIVEGSRDGGNTWHPFIKGYDCRYWKIWLNDFTNPLLIDLNNNLSLAVPDESDMREHRINLFSAPEFKTDDIVLIRFRVSIDPYFSGWGWAIDNMEIRPLVTGNRDLALLDEAVRVYPNPTRDYLNVDVQLLREIDELDIRLTDLVGRTIFNERFEAPGMNFSYGFNLSDMPEGVYLLQLTGGGQVIQKKVVLSR